MSTKIVQCDQCSRVAKQQDAHGWFELRTWVTKPTQAQLEMMMQDPFAAANIQAAGLTGAAPPPQIGGDFCRIDCLLSFVSANKNMLELGQQPSVPADPTPPATPGLDTYHFPEEDESDGED